MTGILLKKECETWKYPNIGEVLKAAGLHTITHYVQVHSQSIA